MALRSKLWTNRQGPKGGATAVASLASAPATEVTTSEMTAGRKAAIAAKEAARAAKEAAIAAQKAAREEHERAILPNKPTKSAIKRDAPLRRPKVVARVRPLAQSGGHSNDGQPVSKRLASWEHNTIVLEDEASLGTGSSTAAVRSQAYNFAQPVLGPDAQQSEVHAAAAADLVKAVCNDGFNGLLFAYGQTGTGKTHTIMGPESSWKSLRHAESGILPRAVAAILDTMRSRESSTSSVLTASAMEFYMSSCLDLLDDGAACIIGPDHRPLGLVSTPIDSEQACVGFMATVRERRHTRATLMNAASDGHDGSSRSHCAMILTLRQLDRASGAVLTTELHVIDMAGAERPKSVQSTMLAMWDHEDGGEPTIAGQGMVINYELSQLRTAVVQATECHQKGLPLINAKAAGTEFVEYTKGCFDCSALLSMIVTLSPARGCGWETWFSCTYGEDLQKLRCPVQPQRPKDLTKSITAAEAAVQRARDELASENALNAKFTKRRTCQLRHDERTLEQLQRLRALGEAGKSSTNEGAWCVVS